MNKFFFLLLFCCAIFFSGKIFAQQNALTDDLSLQFDTVNETHLINPPDVSMVVSDSADPVSLYGIALRIYEKGNPVSAASYTIKARSSNTSVVSDDNISIIQNAGNAIIKVKPYSIGYTTVTATVSKGDLSKSIDINLAVSQAGYYNTEKTYWHTGISDASAAVALDSNYMIIGDDEMNELVVYKRDQSGLPVYTFNYQNLIELTEGYKDDYKEVDVEAAAKSLHNNNKIFWLGSMSNSKNGNVKPNRNKIFATTISNTGANTVVAVTGYYSDLRTQIINWGNAYGYHLSASADYGKNPKAIDGFNAEGMVFAPDSNTLYIGMRAPLMPVTDRTKALIVPIQNFENWLNNGKPSAKPVLDSPIELDLGGRGIREITRLSNGNYIIIAGSYDESSNGAVYIWSGLRSDDAILLSSFDITGLKAEGVVEIDDATGKIIPDRLQIISDDGNDVCYGDDIASKELSQNNYKKFHSDIIVSLIPVLNMATSNHAVKNK